MKLQERKKMHKKGWGIALILLLIGASSTLAYIHFSSQKTEAPKRSSQDTTEARRAYRPVTQQTPVRITIDKIGVNAAIEPVGLTSTGAMDAPKTNEGVGWYNKSSLLGQSRFSVLLDGHYGTDETPAVFYRLGELIVGDDIKITGQQGEILTYKVVETEQMNLEEVDMKKALFPYKDGSQSLTIITCEGTYDNARKTYEKRAIVYAERVFDN